MAVVQFEVSDEIAQRVRAFIESGRESRITFSVRARRVVSVSAEEEWPNELKVARGR